MKRAISILMVIILFTGCSPVFAESKMAIGKDTATTAKENAYTFAYVYLLDPDGFSTDMTDLLYHYTMMYILALATDTAEVKFAAGDGNVSKAEGIDYSRSKAYSSVIENGIEKYKDWLDGKVSNKEFAEYLCSVLDSVTVRKWTTAGSSSAGGWEETKNPMKCTCQECFMISRLTRNSRRVLIPRRESVSIDRVSETRGRFTEFLYAWI